MIKRTIPYVIESLAWALVAFVFAVALGQATGWLQHYRGETREDVGHAAYLGLRLGQE